MDLISYWSMLMMYYLIIYIYFDFVLLNLSATPHLKVSARRNILLTYKDYFVHNL